LHEGLGSYMQPLYMQYLHGDQEYYAALMQQRAAIRNKAPLVSGKHKREEDVYDLKRGGPGSDIYNKGSLVLHTLRSLIGDDAFLRAVRELVYGTPDPRPGHFSPRYATTPEFIAIARRVSGRDLDWFFQAYMYQAALPELVVTRRVDTLDLAWKTAGNTPFPMPLDVRVGERIVTLPMADGHGTIALPAGATCTLDPHSKILRREKRFDVFQRYQEQLQKQAKP
jgi:aminopeptidase N